MTKAFANRRQGTSLIEVLVVIVVFAVGILAVMQVFPGGLRIMADQRDRSAAQQLGKSALQREDGRTEGFPEQILPLSYTYNGSSVMMAVNPNQRPDPTGIGVDGVSVDQNGMVSNASGTIGIWELVSGANIFRRIINEGHRIPSARQIDPNNPAATASKTYGGLVMVNYGPCLTNTAEHASGLIYNAALDIISAPMIQKSGVPDGVSTVQNYVYFIDQEDNGNATLYLPQAALGGTSRTYEVKLSGTVRLQTSQVVHEDVSFNAVVPAFTIGTYTGYYAYVLKSEAGFMSALHVGDMLLSVDKEAVEIARQFTNLGNANPTTSVDFSPTDPYEYKLVNWSLGMILFNPLGSTIVEERPQGRTPMRARISYDVYDWRILHEDFRIPGTATDLGAASLPVRNLKVFSSSNPDGKAFPGLNVPIPDYDSVSSYYDNYARDFALIDTETGAAYHPSGYTVDYSHGEVFFKSANVPVIFPGDSNLTTIPAAGRSVRALFMAQGDWAVQIQKPAADYEQVYDTPSVGQFFIGGTKPGSPTFGSAKRIYFPWSDLGHSVRFDRIAYLGAGGVSKSVSGQSLQITSSQADAVGPFIDISALDSAATAIDMSDGYGVRGVHGASVSVRTLWNRSAFSLTPDTVANTNAVDSFRQSFKTLRLTTSFMGGEAQ